MPRKHVRPRFAHDAAHGLAFPGSIAVNGALGACGFSPPEETSVQLVVGVRQQMFTIRAKTRWGKMSPPAIEPNHGPHGPLIHPNVERSRTDRCHRNLLFPHGCPALGTGYGRKPKPRFRRYRHPTSGAVPVARPPFFWSF
jgi:hypothetical protein